MQYTLRILVLMTLLFSNASCKTKAQAIENIASHKSYTLSHPPNYKLSAPVTDKTSLTDGLVFSGSGFQKQKTVLGWQGVSQVIITVNLEKAQAIKSVNFNAFQNSKLSINPPSDVFVFLSEDSLHFTYAGNATNGNNETSNSSNKLKLSLNNINQKGQYITLIVIPSGKFIFSDEIEVEKGNKINTSDKNLINKENIAAFTDSLIGINYKKEQILSQLNEIEQSKNYNSDLNESSIASLKSQLDNPTVTNQTLDSVSNKVNNFYVQQLKQKNNAPYTIEKYSPWDSLTPHHLPQHQQTLNYDFMLPQNGADYGAFVITNITNLTQKFTFQLQSVNISIANVELFDVPFVTSLNSKMIPDPLIPLTSDGISIEPGNSRLIMFKIKGNSKGTMQPVISVNEKEKSTTLPLNIQVVSLEGFNNNFELNTNIWAYYTYPMLINSKKQAAADLEKHHINTMVIPPAALPKLSDTSTTKLRDYLENIRFAKKVMIAPLFKSDNGHSTITGTSFLSAQWKSAFIKWYKVVWQTVKSYGFTDEQIYFYPYDEVRGEDINDDAALIAWLKKQIPSIKIFGTIVNTNKQAMDRILPLLDVAQIQLKGPSVQSYPAHNSANWLYENSSLSRAESPYSHYRLMAWKAFLNDYNGIGFWAYAGDPKTKLVKDPFINSEADYSVIYNGPANSIISSRRWEAFSLGIEDYQVLYLYSKKFGLEKAKALAKDVVDNASDLYLVNKIKGNMITALQAK
jgi:hypothetical protein